MLNDEKEEIILKNKVVNKLFYWERAGTGRGTGTGTGLRFRKKSIERHRSAYLNQGHAQRQRLHDQDY